MARCYAPSHTHPSHEGRARECALDPYSPRLKPRVHLGAVVLLGLLNACAPPVTKSTVSSTTIGNARLSEKWAPERGVQSITVERGPTGYLLHIQAMRVCRVWEAEQRFNRRTWKTKSNTSAIVGELVLFGTGLGTTSAAWLTTKDRCGSDDLLSSCDDFANGFAWVGLGLAAAGATALAVDLISSGSGEETTSQLGRAIPPHYAPCKNASLQGSVVRLVAPNLSLAGVLNEKGVAQFDVPDGVWVTDEPLDADVVIEGHVVGRVLLRKEAACDGC